MAEGQRGKDGMQHRDFGDERRETLLLLHGGGLSWWNYRETAALLEQDFHVALPILDGHAGSDRPFTSIEENAAEILSWIDVHCGGSVLLIGGLSLGAQILLEMLTQRREICRYALVESAAVIPSRLTNALIAPAFGSSYGLIRNRGFARRQFQALHIKEELFEDYYRDSCQIKKSDMIAFMKANTVYALKAPIRGASAETYVFYGGRETREIVRSAERIGKTLPGSHLCCLQEYYHGEFSLNHAAEYADMIRSIVGGRPGTQAKEVSLP